MIEHKFDITVRQTGKRISVTCPVPFEYHSKRVNSLTFKPGIYPTDYLRGSLEFIERMMKNNPLKVGVS